MCTGEGYLYLKICSQTDFPSAEKKDGRVQLPSSDNHKSQTYGTCIDCHGALCCDSGSSEKVTMMGQKIFIPAKRKRAAFCWQPLAVRDSRNSANQMKFE